MRRLMDIVYLLHFASIAALLVGSIRLLGEARGVSGYAVNPDLAKRVLTHKRAVALGMWGVIATGLLLAVVGFRAGFVAGRLPFPRPLPADLHLPYVLLLIVLIAAALHPMVAIVYRLVPALLARSGNLTPGEAEDLVRRLRLNARLLTVTVLAVLAAGAFRWLYSAGILF